MNRGECRRPQQSKWICWSGAQGARIPGSGPLGLGVTYAQGKSHALRCSCHLPYGHLDIPGLAPRCLECRLVSVRLWRSPQSARPDRVRSQVGKGRTEVKAFSESASCKEAGPRGTAPGWGPESPRAQHWRNRLPCSLPGLGGLDPVDFRRDPWPAGRQSGAPSPRPSSAIQKPAHRAWPTATGCAA